MQSMKFTSEESRIGKGEGIREKKYQLGWYNIRTMVVSVDKAPMESLRL